MPVADAVENPILYDTTLYLWRTIINIFFREIRPRGSHNIPTDGAVIFVGAPHHNQFLDPVLLVSEAYKTAGRRPAFLIAAKSMTRRLIGTFAAAMGSIPVVRSADMAKKGTGNIALSLEDPCLVIGYGTKFTEELAPRKQIMLSKSLGFATAEVVEVISDTEVRVKKEFEDDGGKKTARFRELAQQEKVLTGKDGLAFKVLPHLDQSEMYQHVYKRLMDGGSIGIFPEGGSHDRTDLLPLKAGVSIMALGAMAANPTLRVRIVPVGLSYFHAHKFRSRAVVEFGAPMEVPREYVDMFSHGGGDKRAAISGLLDMIYDALKTVTLRAPDYETLMLVQAGRRLYRTPGRHLTLSQTVELNKRFINGYMHFKDEPRVKALMDEVLRYNRRLRDLGLKDHQVPSARKANWKTLGLLTYRVGLLSVWTLFALPGVIINSPVFILTKVLSRKKQREALAASTVKIAARDVVASWKVIIALGFTPFLYSFYAMAATAVVWRAGAPLKWRIWTPFLVSCALPLVGFSALKFGEAGMDVLKSLRPLIVSLIPGQQRELERLKQWRRELSTEMTDVINEYGPKIYDDFDDIRLLRPSSSAPPSDSGIRRKQTAAAGVDSQSSLLAHPMTWLDERLFGWSKSGRRGNSNWAGQSKSTEPSRAPTPAGSDDEEETGDYDEAVGYLGRYDDSGRKRSRSLQQSYADLQQLKAKSQQGSPTAYSSALPGGEVRRARKGSLTDSVEVKRLAELDPDETFKEATDEVNAENNLRRRY